jgi:hypothetical protein
MVDGIATVKVANAASEHWFDAGRMRVNFSMIVIIFVLTVGV